MVIVVGVLVALAVDRWAAAVDQKGAERTVLLALRDDFAENREIALKKAMGERGLEELARELLAALEG